MAEKVFIYEFKIAPWFRLGYLPAVTALIKMHFALGFWVEPNETRFNFWLRRAVRVVRVN